MDSGINEFIGGSVAILSGLSLGREGPSIQLGACVGEGVANRTNSSLSEQRIYIASGTIVCWKLNRKEGNRR